MYSLVLHLFVMRLAYVSLADLMRIAFRLLRLKRVSYSNELACSKTFELEHPPSLYFVDDEGGFCANRTVAVAGK